MSSGGESLRERAQREVGFAPSAAQLEAWLAHRPWTEPISVDVAVACALFHQLPAAVAWLERDVMPRVERALRRAGCGPHDVDEHQQFVRTHLLLDDGGARLRSYRGEGTLAGYAVTMALRHFGAANRRPQRATSTLDELAEVPALRDLEHDLAHPMLNTHFAAAFEEGLSQLDPESVAVLRLSLVDGLSLDSLAPMLGVSRATAGRRAAAARQALRRNVVTAIAARLGLDAKASEAVLASLESGLDVSLVRLLAHGGRAAGDADEGGPPR